MRAITPFKVIEVGTDQKLVCDFLLVINSNWHPISYRLGVIAAYYSKFGHCVFAPPYGGLGTTYDVHIRLMGKRVVDFLLVLIELFLARCYGWGATSENRSKIGDFAQTRSVWPKISGKRVAHQLFLQILRCWQFSHKETLLQTFFKQSAILHRKRPVCVIEPPFLGGLVATYDDHLSLIGKCVVDFLLLSIELFSLRVTTEAVRANIG